MPLSHFGRTVLRVVPVAFAAGACIEFFMINVRIGSETFCMDTLSVRA